MIHDQYTYRDDISPQRKYQLRARATGKCTICGERGVMARYCAVCAVKVHRQRRERYRERRVLANRTVPAVPKE